MTDCPFCRTPYAHDDADKLAMLQARVQKKDPDAISYLGERYFHGHLGLPKDIQKAVRLWEEAAELGSVDALFKLGVAYDHGDGGVQKDEAAAAEFTKRRPCEGMPRAGTTLAASKGTRRTQEKPADLSEYGGREVA